MRWWTVSINNTAIKMEHRIRTDPMLHFDSEIFQGTMGSVRVKVLPFPNTLAHDMVP